MMVRQGVKYIYLSAISHDGVNPVFSKDSDKREANHRSGDTLGEISTVICGCCPYKLTTTAQTTASAVVVNHLGRVTETNTQNAKQRQQGQENVCKTLSRQLQKAKLGLRMRLKRRKHYI